MRKSENNLISITDANLSKYKKVKEGDDIKSGDCVHISDDLYAEIGKGNRLCRETVNKYNIILRKK